MKAIIPVAGIGSRLRPHTHTQPKSLIPVAGKPILSHIVDQLIQAGINDIVFVIGYLGDKVEQHISTHYPEVKAEFVIQTTGKGIGHAIWLTKELINDEKEVFIVLGDTIFETDMEKVFNSEHSTLGVKKVEDPREFGVAELDDDKYISKLIEKPSIPKSNLALVGLYKIKETNILFDCLEYNIENDVKTQDEFHLTDALMCMVEKGVKFTTFQVDNWFDCGKKDIILQTNQLLLQRENAPQTDESEYENLIIVPPVHIAKGAQVRDSIVGPYVSIGEDAIVMRSIIDNSIIGPFSYLENVVLKNSLIGNDAALTGMVQSLNLGDGTEINFDK
jgi:glucose-1-phosphate thymidylyltransferase